MELLAGRELQVWCKQHFRMYADLQLNGEAVCMQILHCSISDATREAKDKDHFVELITLFLDDVRPLCCRLSSADHDAIIADTPQSTGDPELDEQEAMELCPFFQVEPPPSMG